MIEPSALPPQRMVWTVSALLQAVADTLTARYAVCAVQGEIGSLSRAASGHCYFTLKDGAQAPAMLRCAMFRRAAGLLDFAAADGQRVEVRGRLGVYEPRGELQLIVESMQRAGVGSLYEQFVRLRAKLEGEGLFDASRKRELPKHPRAIGVVTSLDAAALRDVATTLARRAPHVGLVVYPSPVQGAAAPAALCDAIRIVGARREVDVLILCRGGGSLEDLWAFNDERLARAIAACPIAIVSGVGHETDVTLADLAADVRAATPTAAAELVASPRDDLRAALNRFATYSARNVDARMQMQSQRLDRLWLALRHPIERARRDRERLTILARRLDHGGILGVVRRREKLLRAVDELRHRFAQQRSDAAHRCAVLAARLAACDPRHIVARGYALIEKAGVSGLVTDPAQIVGGDRLALTLAKGRVDVQVERIARA